MKKQINKIFAVLVIASSIASCSKDAANSTPNPNPNPNPNPVGNNQWSGNGITYLADTATTSPVWSLSNTGDYSYAAKAKSGDTSIAISFRMSQYLMPSGTYDIVPSAAIIAPNTIQVTISKVVTSAGTFSTNFATTGGKATITNSGGVFKLECSGVGMSTSTLAASLSNTIPTIPAANAAFMVPTGMTANSFTIGTTTVATNQMVYNENTKGIFVFEGAKTTGNLSSIKFYFNSHIAPSGTYDIVSSKSALAPGKVFVEYVNLSPIETMNSKSGGTIVFENTNTKISAYAQNITLTDALGGTTTKVLNGYITR